MHIDIVNPPHWASTDAACAQCGATWDVEPNGNASMDHTPGCAYLAAVNAEADAAEAVLDADRS